jgi:hypothetical protein
MFLAPFKAIRPQPQKMESWINRQIGDCFDKNYDTIDFLSLIQPNSNKTSRIRKRLHSLLRQGILVRDPIPFSDIVATVKDFDLLPPKSTHFKPKPLLGMLIFDFLSQ